MRQKRQLTGHHRRVAEHSVTGRDCEETQQRHNVQPSYDTVAQAAQYTGHSVMERDCEETQQRHNVQPSYDTVAQAARYTGHSVGSYHTNCIHFHIIHILELYEY